MKKPMTIEVNKHYRTRSGDKVFVGMRVPKNSGSAYEFAGYFCDRKLDRHERYDKIYFWSWNGRFHEGKIETPEDIVCEWRDPIKVHCDIYMSITEEGEVKLEAIEHGKSPGANGSVVAVKRKVRIEEGDGMSSVKAGKNKQT